MHWSSELVISVRLQVRRITARGEKGWNTPNSGNADCVYSADDASVLESLSRLPWLFPVAAHGETQEESAVVRSVLNRHQRGVVRCDAASVIESLGAAERPARTAEHCSLMCPDTDMHCVQVFRTSKGIWHHCVPLLIIGLRIVHFFEHLVASHDGFAQLHHVRPQSAICIPPAPLH